MRTHPDPYDRELDELFAAFRRAVPDPEPAADFMPRLWEKIEGRQNVYYQFRRWAQGFVSLAVAASAVILLLQVLPEVSPRVMPYTYVEVLAEDQAPDRLLYQDVALTDTRPDQAQPEQALPK
jgi:hypothetical protein